MTWLVAALLWLAPFSNTPFQKDFQNRLDEYLKLRKTAADGLQKLKPTAKPESIKDHEKELAGKIRDLRRGATQGEIFAPPIAAQLCNLIAATMHGPDAQGIRTSLRRAEPVHLAELHVDQSYPEGVPLQSTPPSLLANLPKLPQDLQYRVVGRALVLLDVGPNLIVDFIPDAIPVSTDAP